MREIDRIAIRSAKPLPLEELRSASPDTLREQVNAHYIALAQFFAEAGVDSVDALKASQKREYDRRCQVIAQIKAGVPTNTSVSLAAARMRLLNRSTT